MIKSAITAWVDKPAHHDQRAEGKNSFLQTGKYESTRLKAVGIANPTLKKAAASLYKDVKHVEYESVLADIDSIMSTSSIYEYQLLAVYVLEKFRKEFEQSTFELIDSWIDHIDYWAISDHLAINLFGHFPLEELWYQNRLWSWLDSDHYWRRRQALTAYLVRVRNNGDLIQPVLRTIERLLPEDNYYIKKAIPWVLRESYRKHPQNHLLVYDFLTTNMSYFSKTMLREAMRYLEQPQQDSLLQLYDSS